MALDPHWPARSEIDDVHLYTIFFFTLYALVETEKLCRLSNPT